MTRSRLSFNTLEVDIMIEGHTKCQEICLVKLAKHVRHSFQIMFGIQIAKLEHKKK